MAVYTHISAQQLSDFLSLYDIGGLLDYQAIAEGVENSNYLIITSTGKYILTLYEKRVDAAELPFFIGLMEHLAANKFPCPQPIRQKNGQDIGMLANRRAAIVSFMPGQWVKTPEVYHCHEVGRQLGLMHLASKGFGQKRANALSHKAWRPLWLKCRHNSAPLDSHMAEIIEQELTFLENNWPHSIAKGIIHADLFNDNVFFDQGKISAFIDFYFACEDLLSYDVAITLNAWCFDKDGRYNYDKGQALLSQYHKTRPLSPEEIDALPILARASAMRFFLTRLYDWFNTSEDSFVVRKDPIEYWHKLLYFTQIQDSAALGMV